MEPIRYMGNWWSVTKPDKKVGGVMTIDSRGSSRLELAGEIFDHAGPVKTVHGAADGKQISIFAPNLGNGGNYTMGKEFTRTQVIESNCVAVGLHLETVEDPVFVELVAEISNLTEWAPSLSGIDVCHVFKREEWKKQYTNARVELADGIDAAVESTGEIVTLSPGVTIRGDGCNTPWTRGFHADEYVRFKVSVDEPRKMLEFWPTLSAMQDLLTIAAQTRCDIGEVTLYAVDPNDDDGRHKVALYMNNGRVDRSNLRRSSDLLFRLHDVGFGDVFNKWVDLRNTVGLPLNVLLALDFESSSFIENQIFNVASSAEGFHGALKPETTAMDADELAAVREKCKEAVNDKEVWKWLGSRLNNYPGLKDRYLELATIPDEEAVRNLVGDIEVWARWLKNARNAIGHLNTGELEKKVPEAAHGRLVYVSKAMLHLVVMQQLGIPAERQREVVSDNWGYSARKFKRFVTDEEEKGARQGG
ncbi:HEPN domain-containing protein [Tsukamurella strandjordii]|uniref:ApeA N-terminal domain-containing protein n=1 Tax=Tsukamurella strandjordii TaxID=147577 RepID=A0AA90ND88_9ACTN|nr:HEPN domain-containing protein [Tsukamurella strandjordii]MDP0399753.1 hypothetical protein [Tsukamurella strandjordii]